MQRTDLQQVFLESASEVLETMFFTGVEDENADDENVSKVSSVLGFNGKMSGKFGVQVPIHTGQAIAANFLGFDEVTDNQVADVVCELSNMLCGSVLSRLESGARFELLHPELDHRNLTWKERANAVGYTFGLGEGSMTIWMTIQQPN